MAKDAPAPAPVPDDEAEAEAAEQAAPTVQFHGEDYKVAEQIGLMPQMRFAKLAQSGADVSEQDSLVAMYDLIEQCFDPADWTRFEAAAIKHRAGGDELMRVVQQVYVVLAGRPTRRPSVSSDGRSSIEPSFTSSHVDRAIAQLDGRPDLQLVVVKAQEAMSQAS